MNYSNHMAQIKAISMPEQLDTIITHADCPDGLASARILSAAFSSKPILFVGHDELEEIEPHCALFCDIAPPRSRASEWLQAGAIVLDHHVHQQDVVQKFIDVERGAYADEPGISGAMLAHNLVSHSYDLARLVGYDLDELTEFAGDDLDDVAKFAGYDLARLAGIRDTWQTEHADWDLACAQAAGLIFFGPDLSVPLPQVYDVGQMLHDKREAKALDVATRIYDAQIHQGNWRVIWLNDTEGLVSDVAEALREDIGAECEILAAFNYDDTCNRIKVSLRALQNGIDVGVIAKLWSGGGHTKAAGFHCSPDELEHLLRSGF